MVSMSIHICMPKFLRKNYMRIGYTAGNSKEFISDKYLSGKICIVLGAEGKGLRPITKEYCDILLKISMSNVIDSLNVSNAAAIIFYEIFKLQK